MFQIHILLPPPLHPSNHFRRRRPVSCHTRKEIANANKSPPVVTLNAAPDEELTELLGVLVAPVELSSAVVELPVDSAPPEVMEANQDGSVSAAVTTAVVVVEAELSPDEGPALVVSAAAPDIVVGASGSAERKLGVGVAVPEYSGHPGTPVLGAARPPPQSGTVQISSVSGS